MYNNPYNANYMSSYNQQSLNDRIDNQIAQLQQMKEQFKNNQQPAINQTFQLAPTNNHTMRFVNTIEDVNKEMVYVDTPFFSKDMSVLWVKNSKGDVKSYELNEIVAKDERDLLIDALMLQIDDLKGRINNDANVTNVDAKQPSTNTTRDDETDGDATQSTKSTSISKISRSKKE